MKTLNEYISESIFDTDDVDDRVQKSNILKDINKSTTRYRATNLDRASGVLDIESGVGLLGIGGELEPFTDYVRTVRRKSGMLTNNKSLPESIGLCAQALRISYPSKNVFTGFGSNSYATIQCRPRKGYEITITDVGEIILPSLHANLDDFDILKYINVNNSKFKISAEAEFADCEVIVDDLYQGSNDAYKGHIPEGVDLKLFPKDCIEFEIRANDQYIFYGSRKPIKTPSSDTPYLIWAKPIDGWYLMFYEN